uniref:Uncharacterized protein n=1 Tax=Rhizophora mucronata TaxID=61149 RepID=A0A2P2PSY8_RHIMU
MMMMMQGSLHQRRRRFLLFLGLRYHHLFRSGRQGEAWILGCCANCREMMTSLTTCLPSGFSASC